MVGPEPCRAGHQWARRRYDALGKSHATPQVCVGADMTCAVPRRAPRVDTRGPWLTTPRGMGGSESISWLPVRHRVTLPGYFPRGGREPPGRESVPLPRRNVS